MRNLTLRQYAHVQEFSSPHSHFQLKLGHSPDRAIFAAVRMRRK